MAMAGNLKRKKAAKCPGYVLFLAVEGKTEEDYFARLRREYRISKQRFTVHNVGNGPVSEVKRFLKGLPKNKRYRDICPSIDYKWGVADTEWELDWKECASRTGEVPKGGSDRFVWALSSASFERWLLLHFVPAPPRVGAGALAAELSKHLPGYSHQHKGLTAQQLDLLMDRRAVALENARRIRESGSDNDDAFTDVDLLVRQIEGMAL